ncbi:DUF2797 domain-containing protein [Elizabethkingia sp. JS20170427COW]|uniref:DUF2797 domain-containing protein n=1 Tax=Elizabethkingia sp. JS20170427COW TaxID=2583851 RepID=UPI00110FFA5E|nr:DUF2797 domain-containing protein [Elizabethkingia sp. JS20170427COW]QCX53183.1 DUF2797 domain-containing protein [Elizabethkingia sp. JS20170427COW]
MNFSGQLLKMISEYDKPIQYYLNLSEDLIHLNPLIGKTLEIKHTGYQCVSCGSDEKIFRMGFCKKCFFESPYASETIIRPELSTAHLGIEERNLEVEKEIQLVPHIVYLAYTGDVKVGVTRVNQIPTRWIDQGASYALPIARTENRYQAGMIEVALKEHMPDKTNFRKMLQNQVEDINLFDIRDNVHAYFPEDFRDLYSTDEELWTLDYPYESPDKVKPFTLDKKPEFKGILKGIKGQYIHFEGDHFINIRGHEGYTIDFTIS